MTDTRATHRPAFPPSHRRRPAARGSLLAGVVALVVGHLALVGYADAFDSAVYDPEYAVRLDRLRARRAERPNDPLLVVIGSSRTCLLFRPEAMPPLATPDGRAVLPFNFSRAGGGPVYSRFAYSRLRHQNLTPDWAVVELMPFLFIKDAEKYFYPGVTAAELGDLGDYISYRRAVGFYAKFRCVPWRSNREGLIRNYAPVWSPPFRGHEPEAIDSHGGEGRRIIVALPPGERESTDASAAANAASLLADFQIAPGIDRAYRDLLRECRDAGTKVVLVRTPESTAMRAAYPAHARAALAAYQADLTREFGVTVFDASAWLPDDEFCDGHHPMLAGQTTFTARLQREVLGPLVAGKLDPACGREVKGTD